MGDNINILDELKALNANAIINAGRENIYFLPDDFFIDFSENIERQIWLNSVSKITPYTVPSGYFDKLSEIIFNKLSINQLNVKVQNVYSVPDGYFNNLADNILEKIKIENDNVQEELKQLSPFLSKFSKTNVYTVPSGYFENLIPQATTKAQPAEIISIGTKTRRWISYAAAACVVALMFGGGYYYMQQTKSPANIQNKYADVKVDQAISQLSDVEISNYLNNDDSDIYIPQNDTQDVDIKALLENMSDEEISNYLLENSDPGNNTKGI